MGMHMGVAAGGMPAGGCHAIGGGAMGGGAMGGGPIAGPAPGMTAPAVTAPAGGMSMVMSHTPTSEYEYLAHMIPHHEEAIASAKQLYAGTARPEMRSWLGAWYPGQPATAAYHPMMRDLTGLTPDQVDQAFLQDMIPHHMMAVHDSMALLRTIPSRPETQQLAASIRSSQMAEIHDMRRDLAAWYPGG